MGSERKLPFSVRISCRSFVLLLALFPCFSIISNSRLNSGKMRELNSEVLNDQDWDRARIYNEKSHGYRPYLLQMFRGNIACRKVRQFFLDNNF